MNVRASLDIVNTALLFSCSGYYINYCNIIANLYTALCWTGYCIFIVFITEILISTLVYLFYLKEFPECRIKIRTDSATVKFSALSFLIIILIQLAVYCYRDYLYHYEPSQINWITVLVMTLVVPYYEEIVYRACAFGFLRSIFKENIIIPCVITSLFSL